MDHTKGRREFITMLTAAAGLGLLPSTSLGNDLNDEFSSPERQPEPGMPTILLGQHKISRLICGSNPLLGYSYMGIHSDRHMKEYFTAECTAEFLLKCERAGITAHQSSSRLDYFPLLYEQETGMKIISLQSDLEKTREAISIARPIAIAHHGGVTDKLFAEGRSTVVHDFVKAVKDLGLLAGISAHNPDVIKQIASEGWEVDFFMTCFYYLTRKHEMGDAGQMVLPVGGYSFLKDDPVIMTEVIRQVTQPCLAFKILGAGRLCYDQESVREAFRFAFTNIKSTDGVIVGMFPWYFDEIGADSQYTMELGK